MSGVEFDSPAALAEALGARAVSEWFAVDQARIDAFADATGDHQWIHVDPERAAAGPFGGPIAHGYLTLSLLPALTQGLFTISGLAMSVNYGLDRLRFLQPVAAGA
ncbi:MaoC family dehydratase, partial [Glycomyces tenuis]